MAFWYAPLSLAAVLLWPLSVVYGAVTRLWHLAFDLGLRRSRRIEGVRVVSVGNLVVGGSGKTPVVIHLANEATRRGQKVAVLSRGYGRRSTLPLHFNATSLPAVTECGDEPRLIARRCAGVEVYVGADRVALAEEAKRAGATLLLLDDGFQHRRLARDVDLLVDGGEGNGLLLPAGPLREPRSGRRRATHVWGRDGQPGDVEAEHVLTHVRDPDGARYEVKALGGRDVKLLLGIARPERVRAALEQLGVKPTSVALFPDHHVFSEAEVPQGEVLLTTEKDAERLPTGTRAWVLELEVRVTKGSLDFLNSPLPASGP